MITKIIVSSILISLVLTGCADLSKEDMGVVTGGALGGLIGSRFGHGTEGKEAAVGVGVLTGAILGGAVGSCMDKVDKMKMNQALEKAPDSQPLAWKNSRTGDSYQVTPTKTFYQGNQPCRDFTEQAIIGDKRQTIYGTACRMDDGTWKINQ